MEISPLMIPIFALCIPLLGMAARLVAAIKAPAQFRGPLPETAALAEEVAQLRIELSEMREKVEFTERLLTSGAPAIPQSVISRQPAGVLNV